MSFSSRHTVKHFALVDDQLVEDSIFLKRRIGDSWLKRREPIINGAQAFGTVLRDKSGLWRMWYIYFRALDPKQHLVGCETPQCIAYSNDGLHWEKPDLGLVPMGDGVKNVVIGSHQLDARGRSLSGYGGVSGFCVIDAEQTPHPAARGRFTAMYLSSVSDAYGGICLAHSEDGERWTGYPENPVIPGNQDTQNCFFYDPRSAKYVAYMRPMIYVGVQHHANRKMARVDSTDLVHWSPGRVCLDTDERDAPAWDIFNEPGMGGFIRGRSKQFQGMSPFPWNDAYLSYTWFYDVKQGSFVSELVRSNDTINWKREALREPLFANNKPEGFPGKLPVPMAGAPNIVGDEMWHYSSNSPYGHHEVAVADQDGAVGNREDLLTNTNLYAIAMKRDRWVGYEASEHEGELLTTPIAWAGDGRLFLNITVREGGHVKVEFEDQWSRPVCDYHLDEIAPISGPVDSTQHPLTFGPGPKTIVKLPEVGPVRLRLRAKHATLWGWSVDNG